MKICFIGGEKAGLVSLLAALTQTNIQCVVSYSHEITSIAKQLDLKVYDARGTKGRIFTDYDFLKDLDECYALLCVHGRDIVPKEILDKLPCVNIHPGFNLYKGASPVERALKSKRPANDPISFDVTAHKMTEMVDDGPWISRRLFPVEGNSVDEIYNQLYPYYAEVTIDVLKDFKNEETQDHVWKKTK